MQRFAQKILVLLGLSFLVIPNISAQLPEGFESEVVISDIEGLGGIRFLNETTSLVWTISGKVLVLEAGQEPVEVLDISEEVGFYGDLGMLGFAVHPDFASNGYIYMLYAVDQYYLLNHDSPDYEPWVSSNFAATISRLTRYQLQSEAPYSLVEGSRSILLGEDPAEYIPQMSPSHGVGSLEFGADASLMVTHGDGTTWVGPFNGGAPYPEFAYEADGLALGLISPELDMGSFKAQYLDSYNGKVLRIDPETGEGMSSNPFFDETAPKSARSMVWAMGLRNPFRMSLRPGTGQSNPDAADPGVFYIGDVGNYYWEEINAVNGPALNFGWPLYEGHGIFDVSFNLPTAHPWLANPLYDDNACINANFNFQDLLVQPTAAHSPEWPNPCDELILIEGGTETFVHERPVLAYRNTAVTSEPGCLVPGYDSNGNAQSINVVEAGIAEEQFNGIASIGGDFYYGASYPPEYFGAYFQSDYMGWVKVFWFDENDQLTGYEDFSTALGPIIGTQFNPYDECMYFTSGFPAQILKVCFAGNVRPVAALEADVVYGPSPLTVQFDASASYDPDGDPIEFYWDFDDGAVSELVAPEHTFLADSDAPQSFLVELSVRDSLGNTSTVEQLISLNNTPPQVDITSIADDQLYSMNSPSNLPLEAAVIDAEHAMGELAYTWQTTLHHNSHVHPEPIDTSPSSTTVINPAGCEEFSTYFYSVKLSVSDPEGLIGEDVKFLYPDCDGVTEPDIPAFAEFVLYPNPTTGSFVLRGPFDEEESLDYFISDLSGRVIDQGSTAVDEFGRLALAIPNAVRGQYVLTITSASRTKSFSFHVE